MKKIPFNYLILIILLSGCSTKPDGTKTSVFEKNNPAQWIQDGRPLPESDSLFYLPSPAPLFRKEFKPAGSVESARLFITAAGYYKASINGNPVGENVLDPAWTDFGKRIYYAEYDVTSLMSEDNNCLGVILGNGFYNPLPLRKWGHRNLRKDTRVGKPAFIAKLILEYSNGKTEEIISDQGWKYAYGPLMKNDVYLGVFYDKGKEAGNWDKPGFDDSSWLQAEAGVNPADTLLPTFFPPVQITEEITPVGIFSPEKNIWIVDMGVNFTGTYRIKLTGKKGDTIAFRFGERIYEDGTLNPMTTVAGQIKRKGVGGPGAPAIAWQTDTLIMGDNKEEWFTPEFTYHTYRYMEISGLDYKPEITDITGLFFHSNISRENQFSCSSELLNSIQEITLRTFRANLISVQSDCPAREKFGYGGDLNATNESFICNFDMQSFYRKTIYDWIDAMHDSGFVDTAPFTGIQYCGISWESAYIITQYYLYLYYNDTNIIKELYERNKKWMEKAARLHPEGIVKKGLSDHESLKPVPVELIGTCHYLQCSRIMQEFARIMNDEEGEKQYQELAERLKAIVKEQFWDKPVEGNINRQTLFATLLYHGIVPENELGAARDSLLTAVKNGPAGHFNTGIYGTKYVLEALSQSDSPEPVFSIVNSTEWPGWGFMIDRGATTVWETWKESDNTFSNCHPMFGSVTEWFYRWLGGIRPDPGHPGFKEFSLAPSTPEGLEFVNCSYHSPYGQIVSNWKKEEEGKYRFEMSIPEGSTANVELPVLPSGTIKIEKSGKELKTGEVKGLTSGKFRLDGGEYVVTMSNL